MAMKNVLGVEIKDWGRKLAFKETSARSVTVLLGQKYMLTTLTYQVWKDKKSGISVDAKKSPSWALGEGKERIPQPKNVLPVQVFMHTGNPQPSPSGFVFSKDLKELDNKKAEHFARFEALLIMGNIYTKGSCISFLYLLP